MQQDEKNGASIAKAQIILRVLLERGHKALRALDEGNVEAFFEILDEREAAFSNFKVLDYQLQNAGIDLAKCTTSLPEIKRVQSQNQQLEALLDAATHTIKSKLGLMAHARRAAQAYHSGLN